jgi:hypothetical protein
MGERVRQACEQLGSTGRTLAAGQDRDATPLIHLD